MAHHTTSAAAGCLLLSFGALTACEDAAPPPDDSRVTLVDDPSQLDDDVTPKDEPVEVEPAASLPNARLVAGPELAYSLTLIASVAPPVVDGVPLQATSVAFARGRALVSYAVAGDLQRGAVDVLSVDGGAITLVSRATFADADVHAVAATQDAVLLATASGDASFAAPAVLEGLGLDADGALGLAGHFRTGLTSFAATSVVSDGQSVFATAGDRGGVFALDASGALLAQAPLDDARGVALSPDGGLVAVRGTPGELVVYERQGLVARARFPFDGAALPGAKTTVEVAGGRAYVAGGPSGALVLDLADGREVARVPVVAEGPPDPDAVTNAVSVERDLVFVSNGAAGVFLVEADRDLTAPDAPDASAPTLTLRGRLAFREDFGSVNHVTYRDGLLFVATGRAGVRVVRVEASCVPHDEIDDNGIDDDCDGVTDVPEPRCDDGLANGLESDVDCGGPCAPCDPGQRCGGDVDCGDDAACVDGGCQIRCPGADGLVTVCARTSTGAPLAGVAIAVSQNGGGWVSLGATDDAGRVTTSLTGQLTVNVSYAGASVTRAAATYVAGDRLELTTTPATVRLRDHAGEPIHDGRGTLVFYGNQGAWQSVDGRGAPWRFDADGEVRLELLGSSGYVFHVGYNGASQALDLSLGTKPAKLDFTTRAVTVRVSESTGRPVSGAAVVYYGNQGTWQTDPKSPGQSFQTDAQGALALELLPVPGYVFHASLRGASQSLGLDVSKGEVVAFQTVPVVVSVRSSSDMPIAGARVVYYGNQGAWQSDPSKEPGAPWTTAKDGEVALELLPVPGYVFHASLRGASQSLALDAGSARAVTFRTSPVTVALGDSAGGPLAGGRVVYYGNLGVWQSLETEAGSVPWTTDAAGEVPLELLPVDGYNFSMSWRGATQSKALHAGATQRLQFSTVDTRVRVVSSSDAPIPGARVVYYGNQGAWQSAPGGGPWVSDREGLVALELLPVPGYVFVTSLFGASQTKVMNAAADPSLVFQTRAAVVGALDSRGEAIAGATLVYYGNEGQWQSDPSAPGAAWVTSDDGFVRFELLPVTGYVMHLSYHGATHALVLDASVASELWFRTVAATLRVERQGVGVDGVAVQLVGNQGRWVDAGSTSGGGVCGIELLPVPGYVAYATLGGATRSVGFAAGVGVTATIVF